ncbi:GNAT family N-acetyltransferase [Arcobacter arenosus]|uniref:GNAT family N-acetyltransferase n=1 Tax=Arcobacter arenosus TaxID=2576037 RepID=UPI003BA88AF7
MNVYNIEKYKSQDVEDLAQLFTNTIHNVNSKDYTKEQIESWAPTKIDYKKWKNRFEKTKPYIVKNNNKIVGFFEFENNGHIDCFYVHHNYQRKGVGNIMMSKIINIAKEKKLDEVFAEVSITAKPFFEKNLFVVERKNIAIRDNVDLVNYIMTRQVYT